MTEFFQIAGMSAPETKRLKSSVRKAMLCSSMWCKWSKENQCGHWNVEEPAFLMAVATPFFSYGLWLAAHGMVVVVYPHKPFEGPVLRD